MAQRPTPQKTLRDTRGKEETMTIDINEGVLYSSPEHSSRSGVVRTSVIERTVGSPTITVRSTSNFAKGVLGEPESVTPYHLLWKLGIRSFNHNTLFAPGEINAHYSVRSYLWALEYWGENVFIATWPKASYPGAKQYPFPKRGKKTQFGHRWNGKSYRPEYAFVALLDIIGWDEEDVIHFVWRVNQLPQPQRLPALRRTAAHYLQNPKDCFAPDGFWTLIYDGGSGFNQFKLL